MTIPFLDLRSTDDTEAIRIAVDRVIERGWFILGPEVEAFEAEFASASGARAVFADVDPERLTLDPDACLAGITPRTAAIVPVHLYGQPADLTSLFAIAQRHRLAVVEDCCQAHLATSAAEPVGTRGVGGAFSFYPTKNLGALGDGGAIITNDSAIAERVRRLRYGGQEKRYE